MDIRVRYFDGCPNWRTTYARLRAAMGELELADAVVHLERVDSAEDAVRLSFAGSPTVLLDGRDAFPVPAGGYDLTCRVYETPDGLAGSPTVDQLRQALMEAR